MWLSFGNVHRFLTPNPASLHLHRSVNKGKQRKISWRKLIKSSLEQKSGGGNLPWRLGVDLAGVAQSRRWELSSRTCLTVLRKSKQPDKCLAAHPRTTLRNVLPTSAPASVAVAGDRQTEPAPGSQRIPLGAPSCTQDNRRGGSPRWKPISKIQLKNADDDWKCPKCPSPAHGVAEQEVTCPGTFFRTFGHSERSRGWVSKLKLQLVTRVNYRYQRPHSHLNEPETNPNTKHSHDIYLWAKIIHD